MSFKFIQKGSGVDAYAMILLQSVTENVEGKGCKLFSLSNAKSFMQSFYIFSFVTNASKKYSNKERATSRMTKNIFAVLFLMYLCLCNTTGSNLNI